MIEWGEVVSQVLPEGTIKVRFTSPAETVRTVTIEDNGQITAQLKESTK
jgi:tRNA A37 threonylcarbamoyladenosine biosynthesis protein TsaE